MGLLILHQRTLDGIIYQLVLILNIELEMISTAQVKSNLPNLRLYLVRFPNHYFCQVSWGT